MTDLINDNSLNQWEHWYKLATDFWNGAQFHLKQEADNAALFCLLQSAECVLITLVRAVLNYDINNHNLSRLLAIIEMFTTDITAVFGLDYHLYRSLFGVLKHAYVNVRYKDGYKANHSDVVMLSGNGKALLGAAKRVYERHKLTSVL
ncbi:HEPN domain-containing protein [Mucilaginibacter glaciei]|uniref:HEPN domain-containing protein n=1 Tax=Mucilaginibacter glaciei TaxID=2772109 RepID=A0A926NTV8_9SPHI|nr:HEPN domain-containing protein [Mucilaginibacter glaciei]MBD1394625.1 HEPN domain-containing protein [Mucilaginibacter glaciei]